MYHKPSKNLLYYYILAVKNSVKFINLYKRKVIHYENVLAKLDTYFNPKINITFERYVFKKASQEEGESASNYVTRLRRLGKTCEYGTRLDEETRHQFIFTCFVKTN